MPMATEPVKQQGISSTVEPRIKAKAVKSVERLANLLRLRARLCETLYDTGMGEQLNGPLTTQKKRQEVGDGNHKG